MKLELRNNDTYKSLLVIEGEEVRTAFIDPDEDLLNLALTPKDKWTNECGEFEHYIGNELYPTNNPEDYGRLVLTRFPNGDYGSKGVER